MPKPIYFRYGEKELAHLKARDARLAAVIEAVGMVKRRVMPDLFAALAHSIVGQQISSKAQATVWRRIEDALGEVSPETVIRFSSEELRALGVSSRKADCIRTAAEKSLRGEFDFRALRGMSDEEAIARLCELDGVGRWSAEMLLIFSLRRPDVLSCGDFGIRRGLRMVHRRRVVDRAFFEKCRRRYSPYCSTASLYLWEAAGGAVPGLTDPAQNAPKKK